VVAAGGWGSSSKVRGRPPHATPADEFERVSTQVRLVDAGTDGLGEDVLVLWEGGTALHETRPSLPLGQEVLRSNRCAGGSPALPAFASSATRRQPGGRRSSRRSRTPERLTPSTSRISTASRSRTRRRWPRRTTGCSPRSRTLIWRARTTCPRSRSGSAITTMKALVTAPPDCACQRGGGACSASACFGNGFHRVRAAEVAGGMEHLYAGRAPAGRPARG
jgi:hypothetical protein